MKKLLLVVIVCSFLLTQAREARKYFSNNEQSKYLTFDQWAQNIHTQAAEWAINQLGQRKLTAPTVNDLKAVYRVLGVPVNKAYIKEHTNGFSTIASALRKRRYSDTELRTFLEKANSLLGKPELRTAFENDSPVILLKSPQPAFHIQWKATPKRSLV